MRSAVIVVGLGFGDEGKGTVVDALCARKDVHLVVRYNGGAQAAHNVVTPDGRHHTFAQWGSGSFHNVPTWLSGDVVVDPLAMFHESEALKTKLKRDPWALLSVDPQAICTTHYHKAASQALEKHRGEKRHGSCGMGVRMAKLHAYDAPEHAIYAHELNDMYWKLAKIRDWTIGYLCAQGIDTTEVERLNDLDDLHSRLCSEIANRVHVRDYGWFRTQAEGPGLEKIVFEGAQGVLLDQSDGFYPYVTPSKTTTMNARTLLGLLGTPTTEIGVLRTFMTRHGPGPLPTEDERFRVLLEGEHNDTHLWQGRFRVGALDLPLIQYAIRANRGIHRLALTHVDKISAFPGETFPVGVAYEEDPLLDLMPCSQKDQSALTDRLMTSKPAIRELSKTEVCHEIAKALDVRIGLLSTGPTCADKTWVA